MKLMKRWKKEVQTTLEQKRKKEETRSPAPKEEENTNNTSQKDDMTDPDNDEYNMDNENVNYIT